MRPSGKRSWAKDSFDCIEDLATIHGARSLCQCAGRNRLESRHVVVGYPISAYMFRTLLFAASSTLGRAVSVTSRNRTTPMRWTTRTRVTRFVTQPPQNTPFYPDRCASMGVRSRGRKSLTVILFIVLGRPWSISGTASVNRRVVRLCSLSEGDSELRRDLAIARSATADRCESYLRSHLHGLPSFFTRWRRDPAVTARQARSRADSNRRWMRSQPHFPPNTYTDDAATVSIRRQPDDCAVRIAPATHRSAIRSGHRLSGRSAACGQF